MEAKIKNIDSDNKQLVQGITEAIATCENLIVQKSILKRELKM
jgi:hypothetical protein